MIEERQSSTIANKYCHMLVQLCFHSRIVEEFKAITSGAYALRTYAGTGRSSETRQVAIAALNAPLSHFILGGTVSPVHLPAELLVRLCLIDRSID
jgi:hypothetical protein